MAHFRIRVFRDKRILCVRIGGPQDFPRLTRALLSELRDEIHAAQVDAGVSAIVLTGTDKCFAAGADLIEVSSLTPIEALRFSALGQSLMNEIERSCKPIVAAIRGYCLGGGFDVALACHLRVAASDATFRHPGASIGIITGWGGTQRLRRAVPASGRAPALEALITGRTLTAQEALRCGLVQRLAEPSATLTAAIELARSLRSNDSRPALV